MRNNRHIQLRLIIRDFNEIWTWEISFPIKTSELSADNNPGLSPMPFNAHRVALIIGFAYHYLLKLDKSGITQISPSRPWQANRRKKGQNWKKRTASDLTAPQRSLTASRGLWRTSAPSRLGLRLAQSHHHLELSAPGQRQTTLKNNDASATVPPNCTWNCLVYFAEKTANLKNGIRYCMRLTHSCLASPKRWHPINRDTL